MSEHRFILEPYKGKATRFRCPDKCRDNKKTFTRYIDTETNEYLADHVGKCSREIKCGYHYTPREFFKEPRVIPVDEAKLLEKPSYKSPTYGQPETKSRIEDRIFKASLKNYKSNKLVIFLEKQFGKQRTSQLVETYRIGSSKHWDGATVFWQIDANLQIRSGKIMLYSATTGKRVKKPFNHINWVHSVLKLEDFKLQQCLFGEHLLNGNSKPIGIVESEKTALIASVYLPQLTWLAVGSLTNLNERICKPLTGCNVCLFPDVQGFQKWSDKAKELSGIEHFKVSDILEKKASEQEKEQGLDLADYLLRFDYRDFLKFQNSKIAQQVSANVAL
jgi:hypothetical protein